MSTFLRQLAMAALFLGTTGCIELIGQRITMHYDAGRDRLSFLIHYDGVHNNKDADQRSAEKALRAFAQNRDVMLFDWFGHIDRRALSEEAGKKDLPALRALERAFAERMQVENLGHYRDPLGQVGAAQLVVFDSAREWIALANAAIDEALLALDPAADDSEGWSETIRRCQKQAQGGHQWLRIEGHALAFSFPVNPGEWARQKLRGLTSLCEGWVANGAPEPVDPGYRMLALAMLSIDQRAGWVTLRIGDPDQVTTLRCRWPRSYRANVETVVAEVAPASLDAAISRGIRQGEAAGAIGELLRWGPPEERVRAAVAAAGDGDGEAKRWLGEFAAAWNAARQFPPAPVPGLPDEWRSWYQRVVEHPAAQ